MRASSAGLAALALVASIVLAACDGSDSNKAGGTPRGSITLTLATRETNDAFVNYAAAVEELSDGAIEVEVRTGWRAESVRFERATIADVREGTVDLAEVGAAVWEELEVASFRALVAPFLIDDLALERRVLELPLIEEMLTGVEALGLVGLAVLPGELRRPFGVSRPLVGIEDYDDATVRTIGGAVADATFAALGANRIAHGSPAASGVDGADLDLATIDYNNLDTPGRVVTEGVVFWPRVRTIVMSRKAFDALTGAEQRILRDAARVALEPALRRVEADEVRALRRVCARGRLGFVSATAADREALRVKVEPVYAMLERDPATRRHIAAIRAVRADNHAAPAAAGCEADRGSTAQIGSRLDGTWRMTVTRDELLRAGTPPEEAAVVAGSWSYEIADGRFAARNLDNGYVWSGSEVVSGSTVTIVVEVCPRGLPLPCTPGETYVHDWSIYRDTVTFAPVPRQTYAPIFIVKPWRRLE